MRQAETCQESAKIHDSSNYRKRQGIKKDRYAPHFCKPEYYIDNQQAFQKLHELTQHLSPDNQVIVWTLTLSALRRPNSWFSGQHHPYVTHPKRSEPRLQFSFYSTFQTLGISWSHRLSQEVSFEEFINTVQVIPLPQSAQRSLAALYFRTYPLEILNYQPEPLELLQIQSKNKRIITFELDYENWPTKMYEARDPLSFWIHDLIHADHFFSHPELRQGQLQFYLWILFILDQKILEPYFVNSEFYNNFCYLISDMNSHPIHLIKTFRAHLDLLNLEAPIWTVVLQKSFENYPILQNNAPALTALQNINTPLFSNTDLDSLLVSFQIE